MTRLIRFALASLSLLSLALAFPALAQAADGYVTGNVNMRAGPDTSYPLVDQLQAGTQVDVRGCTSGWEWCDVIAYGNRGWVAGNFIEYQYQNQPVLLPAYGARIGIPIVSFVIGSYWDSYYRSRPFYSQRSHWYSRPIVRRPPPPPMRRPYRGPAHNSNGPRPPMGPHRPNHSRPPNHAGSAGSAGSGHGGRPAQGNRPSPPAHRPPATDHGQQGRPGKAKPAEHKRDNQGGH